MIQTRAELKEYLERDRRQLGIHRLRPRPFLDDVWKYEIVLRKYEFWLNHKSSLLVFIMKNLYKVKHYRYGIRLGISIPPNTCGMGLSIAHAGCIQINNNAHIGQNLRIHEGVTLGSSGGDEAPILGDNIFLGSGCKVIGNVNIPNNCAVGAGAVVVSDIKEEGVTVAGVPAKIVSHRDSFRFIYWFNDGNVIRE